MSNLIEKASRTSDQFHIIEKEIEQTKSIQFVESDKKKLEPLEAIISVGAHFQQEVLQTDMSALNSGSRAEVFFARIYKIYEVYGLGYEFDTIILLDDPKTYSHTLRVEHSTTMPKQFLARARVLKISGKDIYTLQIKILSARVEDLRKNDIAGYSLATAVKSRPTMGRAIREGLESNCSGSIISGMDDIAHIAPVLTVLDQLKKDKLDILHAIESTTTTKKTIKDLAHTHKLKSEDSVQSIGLAHKLMQDSTAMNPMASFSGDTIVITPQNVDSFAIIPLWNQLRKSQIHPDHDASRDSVFDDTQLIIGSSVLGAIVTFGQDGLDRVTQKVITPTNNGKEITIKSLKEA